MRLSRLMLCALWACSAFAGTVYVSTDVPKTILDNTSVGSEITVPDSFLITDVNVTVNISHTFDSDLFFLVYSPQQNIGVYLAYLVGGSGDNFVNTVFDDSAATPIESGTAPFAGVYRPRSNGPPLSSFIGQNAQGTWSLWVADTATVDTGTLNSWSLEISGSSSDVPEPGSLVALASGLIFLCCLRRK